MKKGKSKVSPTIKSVKPTKDISGSVKRVYRTKLQKELMQYLEKQKLKWKLVKK